MSRVLIIGATSAIGSALAVRMIADGHDKYALVGRNKVKTEAVAQKLLRLGAKSAEVLILDALDYESHRSTLERAFQVYEGIDIAVIAYGFLPDQRATEHDIALLNKTINVNFASTACLLTILGELFERQKHGVIVGFSSVAGDLGRRSNYAYGAAKAGLSVFLAGLRARLRRHGIHVITVKPGRVNTPMTASFSKGKFWSTPIDVADDVARAIRSRKAIVYSPSYWRFVVFFLRILPRRALEKMDI